jgi:putative ATP-dependent endonuclease of OLD family
VTGNLHFTRPTGVAGCLLLGATRRSAVFVEEFTMSDHGRWSGFISRLLGRRTLCPSGPAKLLVLVEGRHDVSFLIGISSVLHRDDHRLPDLRALEQSGELIFIPVGGGDLIAWASRLAPIGLPEIHLLDREVPPVTETRLRATRIVNQRANCRAFVTGKRALENYLHPQCLFDVRGVEVEFGDDDDVPELVARQCYQHTATEPAWEKLTGRARKRCRERAKRWLNRDAVQRMTPDRLAERDPAGEILRWLRAIAELTY